MPVNLLPTELLEKKGPYKLAESLKNIAIAGFAIFFAFLFGAFAYTLILSAQTRSSETKQNQLKQTIIALEETEQKMVLVKDRIGKANKIYSKSDISTSVENFELINANLSSNVFLMEAKIDDKKTEGSYSISSSLGLVRFMSNLLVSDLYSKITMKSFSFTPTFGYMVSLEMVN